MDLFSGIVKWRIHIKILMNNVTGSLLFDCSFSVYNTLNILELLYSKYTIQLLYYACRPLEYSIGYWS